MTEAQVAHAPRTASLRAFHTIEIRYNVSRFAIKRVLIFRLHDKGFARADIHELFRMIDWLLTLPKELEEKLEQQVYEYEERQPMELLSRMELRAIERSEQKGRQEGQQKGMGLIVSRQLTRLFGPLDTRTQARLNKMSVRQIEDLGAALLDFTTIKDLKSWLAKQTINPPKTRTTKAVSKIKNRKK